MTHALPRGSDVSPAVRFCGLRVLTSKCGLAFDNARTMEAAVHSMAQDYHSYVDELKRCALNIHINSHNATPGALASSNAECIRGSLLEQICKVEDDRQLKFERMLQEKYESIDDQKNCTSSLKCRRCNSIDVTWDQKQTRGADEAMTVFCVCAVCSNRWTIR
jgi:DNA-directed RNA polymerase subunit M/transcription elongation factor TFIIS